MRKWLPLAVVCLGSLPLFALGGIEGTMEYAIDAPWRIEPSVNNLGQKEYGAIPIQISIHDANLRLETVRIPAGTVAPRLGNFCSLTVKEQARSWVFRLGDFEEIETSGPWRSPTAAAPTHRVCRPNDDNGDRCEDMRRVAGTAEWHATAWYVPLTDDPGSDIALSLTVTVTKDPTTVCNAAAKPADLITLENHVTVHLGEEPLPRFDNRWLQGDLHYHAQGTDNEGESGYNYRGVARAMGALGVDFVLAAEHASNSRQIMDADVDREGCNIRGTSSSNGLRDMSPERFRFLHSQLHGAGGVNTSAALAGPIGRAPQSYLTHRVFPQIFLGGELDAIPETEDGGRYVAYGNGETYDLYDLLHGWQSASALCLMPGAQFNREPAFNGWLVRDIQGINDEDYGREHLIYLPRSGGGDDLGAEAFVASDTGEYGGASRRLAEAHNGKAALLPEIEDKGYAFLAHPLNAGKGSAGPDGPPWSDFMIRKAWRSPAILGLQFWNEPTHRRTRMGKGEAVEEGYDFYGSYWDHKANLAESQRLGFSRGRFALLPYLRHADRSFETWSYGLEYQLHHGAFMWDSWLLRGLDTSETSDLRRWLPPGEPRRLFVAGGSDAHGDLNYRRTGYFTGTSSITDVAIAKVRNLVFAGQPDLRRNDAAAAAGWPAERHSHDKVVAAIAAGNYSVTDGPAVRIVVDRNRNGVIDDRDTPMGGIVELHGERELPIIVEWRSTPEFGAVTALSLYVGALNEGTGAARIYAPERHGPRSELPFFDDTVVLPNSDARTYALMEDNYWRDPTVAGILRPILRAPRVAGGTYKTVLSLDTFQAGNGLFGNRFYVRAFVQTAPKDRLGCVAASTTSFRTPGRLGACVRHYALTNPVWAITKPWARTCQPSARALDRDGDSLPDGCDPCPFTPGAFCVVAPSSPARGRSPVVSGRR